MYAVFEDFAARPPDPGGTPYSLFWALHEDVTRRADRMTNAGLPPLRGRPALVPCIPCAVLCW